MKTLTFDQRQRRERILSCTREHLSRAGYEGINMRDLAVVAEVSTATLYNLYQSKDMLILAALEDLLRGLNDRVDQSRVKGFECIVMRLESIADQVVETPRYAEAMARMLFVAEASDPIVAMLMGQTIRFHKASLVDMQEAGQLREGTDIGFLARAIMLSGWGVIMAWMKGYIALHDFKREYLRTSLNCLHSSLVPEAADSLDAYL